MRVRVQREQPGKSWFENSIPTVFAKSLKIVFAKVFWFLRKLGKFVKSQKLCEIFENI